MKLYPREEHLNTKYYALEGSEFFGSTKEKLNLPLYAICKSLRSDKMNYSIPCPNTRIKKVCIAESLNSTKHSVAHIISMLEMDCPSFDWHIVRLLSNFTKGCLAMQANAKTLYNVKVGIDKHGTHVPTYKGLKEECRSTNSVEHKFGFCPHDIKCCKNGSTKKYVLDWLVVPNTLLVKINANLLRHEVLVLQDVRFQLR
jgi:hypothetical protein